MLTLLTLAALIFLIGVEYTLLIAVAAFLIYLYPIRATLFIALLLYLKWYGMTFKQKFKQFINKRKPK